MSPSFLLFLLVLSSCHTVMISCAVWNLQPWDLPLKADDGKLRGDGDEYKAVESLHLHLKIWNSKDLFKAEIK